MTTTHTPAPQDEREAFEAWREGNAFLGIEPTWAAWQARAALAATPAAPAVPPGFVLVPVEPTPEMCAAGFCVSEAEHDPAGVYRAMLAAAPKQEKPNG